MNWHQRLDVLRWRSLEEADVGGEFLSQDTRHEATARTRGDLRSADDGAMPAWAADAFLQKRTVWLNAEVSDEKTRNAMGNLIVPQGRWSWAVAGWGLAFVAGFGLTGIGSEREINLLALPLVGLLLWNATVMIAALVFEMMPGKSGDDAHGGWLGELMAKWSATRAGNDTSPLGGESFRKWSLPLAMERLKSRSRCWLHVAAAVLALGSCAGMYAKGWSHEYRAVWESTLLGPKQAEVFFSTLFWPASKATGIAVPVGAIAGMQRTSGVVAQPAAALPWINLYAATLALLVMMPRLLLAAITRRRSESRIEGRWLAQGLESYARRLLRSVEGGGEKVTVLLHGVPVDDGARSRWVRAIQEKFGGQAAADFKVIVSGDEDEFAAAWTPALHEVVIIFQIATTPEEEVQRKLASDVRGRLHARFADGKVIVLIDMAGVSDRWTHEHIESRRALWSRMLAGVADELVFTGDESEMNRLRVPASKTR